MPGRLLLWLFVVCCLAVSGSDLALPLERSWWDFSPGSEFPGAQGKWEMKADRTLSLNGDFRKGGDYVMVFIQGHLLLPGAESLRAKIRTDGNAVTFRIQDDAGKMHQYHIPVDPRKGWQTVECPLRYSECSWGGPDKKEFASAGIRFVGLLVRAESSGQKKTSFLEVRDLALTGVKSTPGGGNYCIAPALEPESLLVLPGGQLTVPLLGPDGEVAYELKDYEGITLGSGVLPCRNNQVRLTAPETEGYFDLQLGGHEISFVVATPYSGASDPYWGIDESFSWWGSGGDFRRGYMRFLKKSGISWGRDRIRWSDLHPERERMSFEHGHYAKIMKWSAEEGLEVLNVFHDAPAWNKKLLKPEDDFLVGADSKTGYTYGSNVYPRDYQATSRSWRAILERFPAIKAMEVWNEPDIGFGNDFPAEFFIALTKNFSTTFRQAGISAKVIGGVLAIPQETTPYYRNLIAGGLLDDCDAFSFHTYRNTGELEEQVRLLRKQESDAGRTPGFPFWITESGRPWPYGLPRPELRQGMYSAQEITGKGIEFRALGIEKYFPFFVIWHTEQNIFNFSMFDQRHAPLRSMGAYVAAVRLLSHKSYIGDLNLPGSDRCRVFSDGKTAVAWVYKSFSKKIAGDWGSLDPEIMAQTRVPLPSGLKVEKILGADGRTLAVKDGLLPMGDGYCYLILRPESLRPFLNSNTPAMALYRMVQSYAPAPRAARDVVIQPDYDLSHHRYTRDGVSLQENENLELRVIFNNLSDGALTVQPALELGTGMLADSTEEPETVLEPHSSRLFSFQVRGDARLSDRTLTPLRVIDRRGNATPMAVHLKRIPPKEPPLPVYPQAKAFRKLAGADAWNSFSGQWTGRVEPDISAEFRFSYEKKALHLEVRILDSDGHFCEYTPMMAWLGDSVQAAFAYGDRHIEFCASSGPEGEKVYRHIGEPRGIADNILLKWNRDKGKRLSTYRITIPAGELGVAELLPGMKIRATLLLNSGGPDGRHGFLIWGDGIRNSKKVEEFNELLLQ